MERTSKLEQFKELWNNSYSHISLELADDEICCFLEREDGNIRRAANHIADYLLSQGFAEIQE